MLFKRLQCAYADKGEGGGLFERTMSWHFSDLFICRHCKFGVCAGIARQHTRLTIYLVARCKLLHAPTNRRNDASEVAAQSDGQGKASGLHSPCPDNGLNRINTGCIDLYLHLTLTWSWHFNLGYLQHVNRSVIFNSHRFHLTSFLFHHSALTMLFIAHIAHAVDYLSN